MGAYNKKFKGRCHKYGKYGHKPKTQNVLIITMYKDDDNEKEEDEYKKQV